MKIGTLYGIGVGPGDPDLITVKASKLLRSCAHLFVPRQADGKPGLAQTVAQNYVSENAKIEALTFPLSPDPETLKREWSASARKVADALKMGHDACFVTLGDPLLYSTFGYLARELRQSLPEAQIRAVPGVSSYSAAASLAEFPLAEGEETITVLPSAKDSDRVKAALKGDGSVAIMKIGKRLQSTLNLLRECDAIDRAVFVARAGLPGQRIVTDLSQLESSPPGTGNLSVILVHARQRRS